MRVITSRRTLLGAAVVLAPIVGFWLPEPGGDAAPLPFVEPNRILAWNDLGMHCVDPDFSLFSILPPYNTINAQLIVGGQIQATSGPYTVTYEAVADATGSINTTSIGKTNFWTYVQALFGQSPAPDVGIAGNAMPGAANVPQPMAFDNTWQWFHADGIPFTPIDDQQQTNHYPMLRIVARDAAGQVVASTVTVAPNSAELRCRECHNSGGSPFALPRRGWAYDVDPIRDDRINILALHDDLQGNNPVYQSALATNGYDPAGLLPTAMAGTPILCAGCHGSNALPGTGLPGITPLTEAIHGGHADIPDHTGALLGDQATRASCYTCHPGEDTKCLRGAMGKAVSHDGKLAMECQDCHGGMTDVGRSGRVGWLDQPSCQNCHSGDAVTNSGAIRYTSVFDATGSPRTPASDVFATDADVPSQGWDLYRFSTGHGDLQCSACHGPPHAIYPTENPNDNVQNELLQGHEGTLTDCNACHDGRTRAQSLGGPHGMHPVTIDWVDDDHAEIVENTGSAQCRTCHGTDYRGTVLSLVQGSRSFNTRYGVKQFERGQRIGCYNCHDGPDDDDANNNRAPLVPNLALSTASDEALTRTLTGTDPDNDPLTLRIVKQPLNGKVAFDGTTAVYRADPGFVGTDTFLYAANDRDTDSPLGTVTVAVGPATCQGSFEEYGFGCPGSQDRLPYLFGTGCPTPGDTIVLQLTGGLGGAPAALVFGTGRDTISLDAGCLLRIDTIFDTIPLPILTGAGPGTGEASYTIAIPPGFSASDFTFQAYILDLGTRRNWSNSNGLEVRVR